MANKKRSKERGKDKKVRKNAVVPQNVNWDFWISQYDMLEEALLKYLEENELKDKPLKEVFKSKMAYNVKYHPYQMTVDGLFYIKNCLENECGMTLNGLSLGMKCSYDTFKDLSGTNSNKKENRKSGDLFIYPLRMLRTFVAMFYEQMGNDKLNPTFPIFLLKNMGMEDKQVVQEETEDTGFTPEERDKIRENLNKMISR